MATIEKWVFCMSMCLKCLVLDFSLGSSTSLAILVCRGDGMLKQILLFFLVMRLV